MKTETYWKTVSWMNLEIAMDCRSEKLTEIGKS